MGLDMYLTKETHIWPAHMENFHPNQNDITLKCDGVKTERVSKIVEDMGYWRKANAIHKWFVDNVQEGVDECQKSYISKEDLQKLLSIVDQILESPDKAAELLPTQSGFFFGSTEYDEWYFEDLKQTKEILAEVLSEMEADTEFRASYYYQSSW